MDKQVFFYRKFTGFSGGHLKVRHYFDHINATPGHSAHIFFEPESTWGPENPWNDIREQVMPLWQPEQADILFLAGLDWLALSPAQRDAPPAPIINLIQHVRHADIHDPRYPFLRHPAIRICVSQEVETAILTSGQVSTPIRTIPNGIDLSAALTNAPAQPHSYTVLIAGLKDPALARELATSLQSLGVERVKLLTDALPRPAYLALMAQAQVVVLLPSAREGFYLPALEAMALGCMVVCPDCVGNRSFCLDRVNCYRPAFNLQALVGCALKALQMNDSDRSVMLQAAAKTTQNHSLAHERSAFQKILFASLERPAGSFE
jgi:glycosyltransferase involved in cell wall biosynthesis